ncbi:DUF5994 family protein [Speluncibacter jeojiensis]|uniref:DUF5994 family protein n=1 Tax=Speluncibacter jeojiensis TaxID=2710754 RepID=A0A9X4LZ32_9ACTN|nr:DUF5994 family protein [Corynebacteriales bacterium D3-21]
MRLNPTFAGFINGAWWPRTRDLTHGLPALLDALFAQVGLAERVIYDLDEWSPAPERIRVHDHTVRLDGYRFQPRNTLYVLFAHRIRLTLLVVPPCAEPRFAHATLMAAATPNDATSADELLMTGVREATDRSDHVAAQKHWGADDGPATARWRRSRPRR